MKKICIIFLIFLSACTNLQKGNEKNSTHENQTKNISNFYEEWYGVPYKYGGISKDGVEFTANMPTEEVFTAPHRLSANGKVVASMPLFYNGNRVEDFWFIFKDGKVVDYDAKVGKDILTKLLNTLSMDIFI